MHGLPCYSVCSHNVQGGCIGEDNHPASLPLLGTVRAALLRSTLNAGSSSLTCPAGLRLSISEPGDSTPELALRSEVHRRRHRSAPVDEPSATDILKLSALWKALIRSVSLVTFLQVDILASATLCSFSSVAWSFSHSSSPSSAVPRVSVP